jgi:hypothetical protein
MVLFIRSNCPFVQAWLDLVRFHERDRAGRSGGRGSVQLVPGGFPQIGELDLLSVSTVGMRYGTASRNAGFVAFDIK